VNERNSVTLDDFIVFSDGAAASNLIMWAHELTHFMQYMEHGHRRLRERLCDNGILLHVRGYSAIEAIGRATFEGRVGMFNFEVCTNPLGGNQRPVATFGAIRRTD
jgi:hypothetical protein